MSNVSIFVLSTLTNERRIVRSFDFVLILTNQKKHGHICNLINLPSHLQLLLHLIYIISFLVAIKLPSYFFESFQIGIGLIGEGIFVFGS